MTIRFHCRCGQRLRASEEAVGRLAKCPKCGESVEVPTQTQAANETVVERAKKPTDKTGKLETQFQVNPATADSEEPAVSRSFALAFGLLRAAMIVLLTGSCLSALLSILNFASPPKGGAGTLYLISFVVIGVLLAIGGIVFLAGTVLAAASSPTGSVRVRAITFLALVCFGGVLAVWAIGDAANLKLGGFRFNVPGGKSGERACAFVGLLCVILAQVFLILFLKQAAMTARTAELPAPTAYLVVNTIFLVAMLATAVLTTPRGKEARLLGVVACVGGAAMTAWLWTIVSAAQKGVSNEVAFRRYRDERSSQDLSSNEK